MSSLRCSIIDQLWQNDTPKIKQANWEPPVLPVPNSPRCVRKRLTWFLTSALFNTPNVDKNSAPVRFHASRVPAPESASSSFRPRFLPYLTECIFDDPSVGVNRSANIVPLTVRGALVREVQCAAIIVVLSSGDSCRAPGGSLSPAVSLTEGPINVGVSRCAGRPSICGRVVAGRAAPSAPHSSTA